MYPPHALIAGMRAMDTVMDAVTGVYEQPRKKPPAVLQQRYIRQDSDLATKLRAEVTQIEFTSLWRGSAMVGAGDYRKLYQVDAKSGLDMLYVWISGEAWSRRGEAMGRRYAIWRCEFEKFVRLQ